MTKREVIHAVLKHQRPPYVPWSIGLTLQATQRLQAHLNRTDLEAVLQNHLLKLGNDIGFFQDLGNHHVQDVFGVVWDRTVDQDIGIPKPVLPQPSLSGYTFPDPRDQMFFANIPDRIQHYGDRFRVFQIGFSLYERAWTLRGMQPLMMDFHDHPDFVRELLDAIADFNIAQIEQALTYDIDAVYFGDDWGQQHGLQMGPALWRQFILPVLTRMYRTVRQAGKFVLIHSCGDVDELFDDLIDIGLDCFNPFQPEVMDVFTLMKNYHGRLAFHGGLSTQKTLPYGSVHDVKDQTQRLIKAGKNGGYIFAPAHDVEADVPPDNIIAFLEILLNQPGFAP